MKKLIFTTLICFWGIGEISCRASSSTSDLMEIEPGPFHSKIENNAHSLTPDVLEEGLNSIQRISDTIKQGYLEAKCQTLFNAYTAFNKLSLPDQVWETYLTQLNIKLWPKPNTWKKCVGSHLFFPFQSLEWINCFYKRHLVTRFDIVWGFAISAKFNHSLGKYLLVDTFYKIREHSQVSELTPFFQNYLTNTINELKGCLDHPDACYLLGRGQTGNFSHLVSHNGPPLSAHQLFSHHPDNLRNKCYAFGETDDNQPTVDTYLDLARQGYSPAYLETVELIEDNQEKEAILKEACGKHYGPAFLELGYLYSEEKKDKEAAKFFKKAGEKHSMTKGYIALGMTLVGDPRVQMKELKKDISSLSQGKIEEAAEFFKKAGEAKDPEGWECLIALWKDRFETAKDQKNKDIYKSKLEEAIQKGMQIGLPYAYYQAHHFFETEYFLENVRAYGLPLQGDIRMNWNKPKEPPVMLESQSEIIEKFLKTEG